MVQGNGMRIAIMLLVLLLAATGSVRAETAGEAAGVEVPLDEFLRVVPEQDKGFHRILIDELKLKYKKALDLPAGDWVAGVLAEYDFDPKARAVGEDTQVGVSLDRLFPKAGLTLSAEAADSSMADYSYWEAGISQDIARNAFGRAVRLEDKIVGIEIEIARHQIVEAYEDYLSRLIQVYLDWYFAYQNLRAARQGHRESLVLLENVKERLRRSVALDVDVDKVKLQTMEKEERVVRLEADYEVQSNLVRRAMGLELGTAIFPRDPTARWNLPKEAEAALERFGRDSRTARLLRWAEERGAQSVLRYADDLLPSLKLGVAYRETDWGGALQDEQRVYSSVELSLPLVRPQERAIHSIAKVELDKAKFTTQDVLSRVGTDLRNLTVQILSEQQRIGMTDERIAISESILEAEKENYSFGRTSLNDLIRFADGLENQRFARIAGSVQCTRYLVEWLRLSDRLVTARQVLKEFAP
jgi:outer membrane protein TolC